MEIKTLNDAIEEIQANHIKRREIKKAKGHPILMGLTAGAITFALLEIFGGNK